MGSGTRIDFPSLLLPLSPITAATILVPFLVSWS
jgi:hypothetical protein